MLMLFTLPVPNTAQTSLVLLEMNTDE